MAYTKQTHCKRGHLYTEDSVYIATRKDGRTFRQCRECTNALNRSYYQDLSPEERRARRQKFPSQAKMKHYQRKYKYGLAVEQIEAMLAYQGGGCGICGRPLDLDAVEKNAKVSVDHDHVTGEVRALLCQSCNAGLGMFEDDIRTLRMAVAYLLMHKEGVA